MTSCYRITAQILFGSLLVVMILPFSNSSFAMPMLDDSQTLREQIESGIENKDLQCNENRVLVLRDNGKTACVKETTAVKTGWEIESLKIDTSKGMTKKEIREYLVMNEYSIEDIEHMMEYPWS